MRASAAARASGVGSGSTSAVVCWLVCGLNVCGGGERVDVHGKDSWIVVMEGIFATVRG